MAFGDEPWFLAVGAAVAVAAVALVPLTRLGGLEPRARRYFLLRASLLAAAGLGIALGHWWPSVGSTTILLAVMGLLASGFLRRRLLGPPSP